MDGQGGRCSCLHSASRRGTASPALSIVAEASREICGCC
jgi:hypothetical protein